MGKIPINHKLFKWQTPTQGVLYTVGYLTVPANAVWMLHEGMPFIILLPVYEETTADAAGAFSLQPKQLDGNLVKVGYWNADQLIYVYDVTNSRPVNFTYDPDTNTVTGTAGAGATVRVYYIPMFVEMRLEAKFQTPEGRKEKTLWAGDTGTFLYRDLAKDKVRLEAGVGLIRSDQLIIKARSDDSNVIVDPFLPDGRTLVPILRVKLYAEQTSRSVR